MTHDPREALEPCPFCGGEAELRQGIGGLVIQCQATSCNGTIGPFEAADLAAAAWNTRALTASPGEQKPPPAAGWNEAITTAVNVAKQSGAKTHPRVEALRRSTPAPEGVASIVTCCVTGAIPGDGGACGDCDPCIMGEASVPEAVKRLIAEKNSLIQRIGELEDASGPDAGGGVREAAELLPENADERRMFDEACTRLGLHPLELIASGLHAERHLTSIPGASFYERRTIAYNELHKAVAALSNPPAAAERDCEVCGGDCASANPPVAYCPVKERKQCKEAVNKAREMLKLGINIQTTGNATNVIVTGIVRSLLDCIDDLEADLKCAIAVGRMAARPAAAESKASVEARLIEPRNGHT